MCDVRRAEIEGGAVLEDKDLEGLWFVVVEFTILKTCPNSSILLMDNQTAQENVECIEKV